VSSWPFTWLELTAGLRRYLADPTLKIVDIVEEPVPLTLPAMSVRGVGVDVDRYGHAEHYSYMVTQPPEVRLALPGWGRREVGFLRNQAFSLPIALPELVTADAPGSWIMLEPYPPRYPAEQWTANDYRQAVLNLAALQDRYWTMQEDLAVYPWVSFPLKTDFETICLAASKSIETIIRNGWPPLVCESIEYMTAMARLITQADTIAKVLQSVPQTLLHGNYWPGNISIDEDGRHVVYDWQSVGVGPGILDLVTFILKGQIYCPSIPADTFELISLYRYTLAIQARQVWSETEWQKLWDHALMWRFLQEQIVAWSDPAAAQDEVVNKRIEEVWLAPVTQAVDRWLDKYSYL